MENGSLASLTFRYGEKCLLVFQFIFLRATASLLSLQAIFCVKIIYECSGAVLGSKSYHAATLQMVLLFCQDCAVYANIFADNAFCPNDIINSSGISEVVPLPQYLMRGKRRRRKYTWP